MKNKFQKANWRRFSAFFAFVVVMFTAVFCSAPALAASSSFYDDLNDLNEGYSYCYILEYNKFANRDFTVTGSIAYISFHSETILYGKVLTSDGTAEGLLLSSNEMVYSLVTDLYDGIYYLVFRGDSNVVLHENDGNATLRQVTFESPLTFSNFSFISDYAYFYIPIRFYSYDRYFDGFGVDMFGDECILYFLTSSGDIYHVANSSGFLTEKYRVLEFDGFLSPVDYLSFAFCSNCLTVPYHVPRSFFWYVRNGLDSVISWIVIILFSLAFGPLQELGIFILISISVSFIVLVVYLIRRFIWGT